MKRAVYGSRGTSYIMNKVSMLELELYFTCTYYQPTPEYQPTEKFFTTEYISAPEV